MHPFRTLLASSLLALTLTAACEPTHPSPPPYRPNTSCADACAHRAALGCLDAQPTKKGASCGTVCEEANASGLARWPTDCLVATRTCEEGRSCRP